MSSLKSILLTGSSGFLGRVLSERLLEQGHRVIGVDLFRPEMQAHKNFQFICHDLRRPGLSLKRSFDLCVHLASGAGGFLRNSTQLELVQDELLILQQLKKLCELAFCNRMIFFSSMNVFENSEIGQEAALQCRDQVTPYAQAKALAESFIENEFQNFSIVRPTNFFGHDQPHYNRPFGEAHVIPDLIRKMREQDYIEVFGDGSQIRNFLHVSDISNLVLLLMATGDVRYVHLRSDLFLSIRDLVDELKTIYNCSKPVRFLSRYLRYEPKPISRFQTKAAEQLGWTPQISSLQEGLRRRTITPNTRNMSDNQSPERFQLAAGLS